MSTLVAEPARVAPLQEAIGSTRSPIGVEPSEAVISPELVLVCPELRARALALLPDRDPDGYIPRPGPAEPAAGTPLAVGAAAYVLQTLAGFAVVGVKLIAVVVGLTLLAEFAHVL